MGVDLASRAGKSVPDRRLGRAVLEPRGIGDLKRVLTLVEFLCRLRIVTWLALTSHHGCSHRADVPGNLNFLQHAGQDFPGPVG